MIRFRLNGVDQALDCDPEMPILWAIRDLCGLTGTKYGCGQALCGACTVHIDGEAVKSCTVVGVPQCGFCQAGQIMTAAALLSKNPKPSDADIDQSLGGNICRCGTYNRIRAAVKKAAGT